MASSTARAASRMNAVDPGRWRRSVSQCTGERPRSPKSLHSCNPPASASHLEGPFCAAVVEAQVEALLAVGTRDDVARDELIKRAGYRHFDLRSVLGPESPPHGVRLERR